MANSNERNPISISDQKKRSLEALERRIAVAKSELVQLQPKHCTSVVSEDQQKQKQQQIVNKSLFSPFHTPTLPCDTLPSTKSFPVHSSVEGDDVNDTTYSQLSQPVHENLLRSGVKLSNGARVVNEILNDLLVKGDAAQKYMQGSKSMKIDGWLLLDTSVQGRGASTNARLRPLKSHSKRSKIRISMKQHRKYGNFNLPQKFINFYMYKPMHEMWKDYIIQILNLGERNRARCLLTADLHGAFLLVAESKITSFTGTRGIMVRETTETFGMVTNDNKFCVLPKKGSIFIFQASCWKITLHGDELSSRSICQGDWLHGLYVYFLYSQYGFSKGDIGHLFIAGFGSIAGNLYSFLLLLFAYAGATRVLA